MIIFDTRLIKERKISLRRGRRRSLILAEVAKPVGPGLEKVIKTMKNASERRQNLRDTCITLITNV